jgi:hypothetical protein
MYTLYKYLGQVVGAYKEDGNGIRTMFGFNDPDNTDYQAYLKHIAEGGEVLPADNEQTA